MLSFAILKRLVDKRGRTTRLATQEPESVEQMSEKFAELCNEDGYLQENASKAATVAFLQWLGFNPAGAGRGSLFFCAAHGPLEEDRPL